MCCIACWRALSSGKLSVMLGNWTLWKRSILIWKLLTSPRSRECFFFCLQTRSRCVARPASHEGGACDPGTALPHSEGTLYRVYETLSRSREHRLARPQSTQSFLCLLQGKTMDFFFFFFLFLLKPLFTLGSFFFFLSSSSYLSCYVLCRHHHHILHLDLESPRRPLWSPAERESGQRAGPGPRWHHFS